MKFNKNKIKLNINKKELNNGGIYSIILDYSSMFLVLLLMPLILVYVLYFIYINYNNIIRNYNNNNISKSEIFIFLYVFFMCLVSSLNYISMFTTLISSINTTILILELDWLYLLFSNISHCDSNSSWISVLEEYSKNINISTSKINAIESKRLENINITYMGNHYKKIYSTFFNYDFQKILSSLNFNGFTYSNLILSQGMEIPCIAGSSSLNEDSIDITSVLSTKLFLSLENYITLSVKKKVAFYSYSIPGWFYEMNHIKFSSYKFDTFTFLKPHQLNQPLIKELIANYNTCFALNLNNYVLLSDVAGKNIITNLIPYSNLTAHIETWTNFIEPYKLLNKTLIENIDKYYKIQFYTLHLNYYLGIIDLIEKKSLYLFNLVDVTITDKSIAAFQKSIDELTNPLSKNIYEQLKIPTKGPNVKYIEWLKPNE